MEHTKVKNSLELVTNIAVLLIALVVLGNFAWHYLSPKPRLRLQSGLQKGDPFPELQSIDYSNSPQTLLIAISSRCEFCSESVPFYKQVSDAGLESSNSTRIVAVFPDPEDEARQYIQQKHLSMSFVARVNFKALNLVATPTVILVDNTGKILDFWIGKPSKEAEQQILKAINANQHIAS